MKPLRALIPLLLVAFGNTAMAQRVAPEANPAVTISIDAAVNRYPIDPRIYGVAFASTVQLTDLGATMNRWGGNADQARATIGLAGLAYTDPTLTPETTTVKATHWNVLRAGVK